MEKSQHDSYLRMGEQFETYFSNGNSCKRVTYKDNILEIVGMYPTNTFSFFLPTKSIPLSSF